MNTIANKTIRLSEGETEMLMRALVEANEQCPAPKTGETQILLREARTTPPAGNTEHLEQSNFIL